MISFLTFVQPTSETGHSSAMAARGSADARFQHGHSWPGAELSTGPPWVHDKIVGSTQASPAWGG
jgi:hypothetical protein